jgi:predicted nucleotidyltransferase
MLPGVVHELVGRYLRQVDLAVPGAIEGFYVVGSAALGAFRPGRSDVDFVAVVGDRLGVVEVSRLRWAQRRLYAADLAHTLLRPPWRWPLTCNGVFVTWATWARHR